MSDGDTDLIEAERIASNFSQRWRSVAEQAQSLRHEVNKRIADGADIRDVNVGTKSASTAISVSVEYYVDSLRFGDLTLLDDDRWEKASTSKKNTGQYRVYLSTTIRPERNE